MPGANAARSTARDEPLATAVDHLADQMHVLREAIDELRSAIRWGLQNDKFRSPETPPMTPPEIDYEQLQVTLHEACSEVGSEAADAVREALRGETQEIRDSLDQFSLDIQWAVRQVREAVPAGLKQHSLFDE